MPTVQCRASAAATQSSARASQNRKQCLLLRRVNLKFTGLDLPAPDARKREHEQHRANCRQQKRQAHILLEEKRNANSHSGGETTCHGSFCLGPLQEPESNQNPECALAVVFGNWNDAVDAEKDERRGHEQRNRPLQQHARASTRHQHVRASDARAILQVSTVPSPPTTAA